MSNIHNNISHKSLKTTHSAPHLIFSRYVDYQASYTVHLFHW
uniref:Uncharacterized protein n=1 Tax=Anguilla anguilla TaxID=7936 RepID=A0A0E9T854_ANGAN